MAANEQHSLVNSKFPVYLPYYRELYMSDIEFNAFIDSLSDKVKQPTEEGNKENQKKGDKGKKRKYRLEALLTVGQDEDGPPRKSPFMDALSRSNARLQDAESLATENKALTENADVAHLSAKSALVDAFYELEGTIDGDRLSKLLEASWQEDALATLKIVFNIRSIHLGKSSRPLFYEAMGWLYEQHPKTTITNLIWLVRPTIEKKVDKGDNKDCEKNQSKAQVGEDEDIVLIEAGEGHQEPLSTVVHATEGTASRNVTNGMSHGYFKDLLAILALAAHDELRPHSDGDPLRRIQMEKSKLEKRGAHRRRDWDHESAKRRKVDKSTSQHDHVIRSLENPKYRALHFTVARIFADQLKLDISHLQDKNASKTVTYAGKWAPSPKEAHDKHTFVVSSIAELLHDHDSVCPGLPKSNRDGYLKHAREAYRRLTISPLRKHLKIVERDLTAKTYDKIEYGRLPSLAMRLHQNTFIEKDFDRFQQYIQKVSQGEARISGATLLPSQLISDAWRGATNQAIKSIQDARTAVKSRMADGQWQTLVQRISDSGSLKSSIAVCDVSGSMCGPIFKDKTRPIDSAIGLSLLLAEVCEPPFGGGFISFSANPTFLKVGGPGDKRTLAEKITYMASSEWGMNTDFVAVFERLILPMAIENGVKAEDMVKQVFVFSDMQFDAAENSYLGYSRPSTTGGRWSSSFERIKAKYEKAGYEMPQLIFWNLAGGRESASGKPVTKDDGGTALVSGYSAGQMKMFLDGGNFEELEAEETIEESEIEVKDGEGMDGDTLTNVKVKKEKPKMGPLAVVKKAISHPAYAMLKVVD